MGSSAASAVAPRPGQAIESFLRSFSLSVEGFNADQLGPNIGSCPLNPHPLMVLAGERRPRFPLPPVLLSATHHTLANIHLPNGPLYPCVPSLRSHSYSVSLTPSLPLFSGGTSWKGRRQAHLADTIVKNSIVHLFMLVITSVGLPSFFSPSSPNLFSSFPVPPLFPQFSLIF